MSGTEMSRPMRPNSDPATSTPTAMTAGCRLTDRPMMSGSATLPSIWLTIT